MTVMDGIEKERLDPHLRVRRERIAARVLAQVVRNAGEYRSEHSETALKAADGLINALDSEGV
jgi:hypothetical protein